jgi:hypothetical protein
MKDGATGQAPRPAAVFGRRHLYTESAALAYARELIRSTEAVETTP